MHIKTEATAIALALALALGVVSAQVSRETPYKLGTFAQGDRAFLGLVLNDTVVVDLSKADPALPTDMKVLLQRYDSGPGAALVDRRVGGVEPPGARVRCRQAENAAARHAAEHPERRGELHRARTGDGRPQRQQRPASCGKTAGRGHSGNLAAQAGRHPSQPLRVSEDGWRRGGKRRRHSPAARARSGRLGVRARRRDRPHRVARARRARRGTTSSGTRCRTTSRIARAAPMRVTGPTGSSASPTIPSRRSVPTSSRRRLCRIPRSCRSRSR